MQKIMSAARAAVTVFSVLLTAALWAANARAGENLWYDERFGVVLEYSAAWKPLPLQEPYILALDAEGVDEYDYPFREQILVRPVRGAPGKDLTDQEIRRFQETWRAAGGHVRGEGRFEVGHAPAYYIEGGFVDGQQPMHVYQVFVKQDGVLLFFLIRSPTDANFEQFFGHRGTRGVRDILSSVRFRGYYPRGADTEKDWGLPGLFAMRPVKGWTFAGRSENAVSYTSDDWLSRITIFRRDWVAKWDRPNYGVEEGAGFEFDDFYGTLGLYTITPGRFDPNGLMEEAANQRVGAVDFKTEWGLHYRGNKPVRRQILFAKVGSQLVVIRIEDRGRMGRPVPGRDLLAHVHWQ